LFFGANTPCGSHASADVEAANASLKKRLGIKDCPRCDTALEKVAGCDVVRCGGCRAVLCWSCLAVFEREGLAYQHLRSVQGGLIFGGHA
jgi:hypothetical protein